MRAFVVSAAGEDKPTAGNIQTFDDTSRLRSNGAWVSTPHFAPLSCMRVHSRADNQRKSRRGRFAWLLAAVEQP